MPLREPTFEWEDPPEEAHRPVSPKRPQPVEVYELVRTQPPDNGFLSTNKIVLIGFLSLCAIAAIFFGIRYSKSSASPVTETSAASPPESNASITARAPQVGYVKSWGVTASTVSISWSTNVAATGAVAYGTSPALGSMTALQAAQTITHGVQLTGLRPSTTYYFVVQSADSDGVVGYSETNTVTTIGAGPLPVISDITVVPEKNNQAKISWKTSVPTSNFVQIGKSASYDRWSKRTDMTTDPDPAIGWVPSGVIHFQVVSVDANGNQATSQDQTFVEP